MSTLYTLAEQATARQEIKKSRFIAAAAPVDSEDAAKQFIAMHSDATANHNCWAWRIGQNYRFNDDGEPTGTAGKPILQAIDGQALDRVVVVVTRWFGGVLLGGGGLIRAYGGTAAICLRAAMKNPIVDTVPVIVSCGFSDIALLQARLSQWPGVEMQSPAFNEAGATWSLRVPRGDADQLGQLVRDVTSGSGKFLLED